MITDFADQGMMAQIIENHILISEISVQSVKSAINL